MAENDQPPFFKVRERGQRFRVKAVRKPGSFQESPFTAKSTRRLTPEEITKDRERILQETIQGVYDEAQSLSIGRHTSLDIHPRLQQSNDTCMIACAIAIREGIARSKGETIRLNEEIIAFEARRLGLLGSGGMATSSDRERPASLKFLEENTGVVIRPLLGLEPHEIGRACVNAIRERNIPLLNSFKHWVAIYGFEKLADQDIRWNIADPLRVAPRTLTTPEISELFLGGILKPSDRSASQGEVYIAEGPGNANFTALRRR